LIIWGGWLLVTGLAFSLGKGIIHPYYNVALAPALGALIGIGIATMWQRRDRLAARAVLGAALLATAAWSYELLGRTPTWFPWLPTAELALGVLAAALVVAFCHRRGLVTKLVAGGAVAVALTGTSAYTLATAAQAHAGAIPSVGPSVAAGAGFGGGGGPGGGGAGLGRPVGGAGVATGRLGLPGARGAGGAFPPGGFPTGGPPPGAPGAPAGRGAQGIGGLLNGSTPSKALTAALGLGAKGFTWVAATVGANQAAGYQLATGDPVMAIGGFNGTDPYPTLAQFQTIVAKGEVHYFIPGGGAGGGPGGGAGGGAGGAGQAVTSTSSQISTWVQTSFTAKTVGGVTLYDLTAPLVATAS
jgi:4-amino-4-deoxy-L-arabinose transferase-like glycosyltransferase